MEMRELTTTAEVIETLGGLDAVTKLTGCKYKAVANWKSFGSFPAKTYVAITAALAQQDCCAPAALWGMVANQAEAQS